MMGQFTLTFLPVPEVTIRGTADRVAGSPIAVTSGALAIVPFDHSILIESKPERSHALKERLLRFLPPNSFLVVEGDCNSEIDLVVSYIKKRWQRPIILAFLDPEGM